MKIGGVTCPQCHAGFRRIELSSLPGIGSEYRCPICHQILETFDGSKAIAYRLTVLPESKLAMDWFWDGSGFPRRPCPGP